MTHITVHHLDRTHFVVPPAKSHVKIAETQRKRKRGRDGGKVKSINLMRNGNDGTKWNEPRKM